MRYYQYDYNYIYTGYIDSDISVSSATTTPPADDQHIIYDPDTDMWNMYINTKTVTDYINDELLNAKSYFDDLMINNTEYTADFESSTYGTQEIEWKAWVNDKNAYTPYVKKLSDKRNLTIGSITISGDETSNLSIGDTILGADSNASGVIDTITYDSTNDITTINLIKIQDTFNIGETIIDDTYTTTGTITNTTIDISTLMNKIGSKIIYFASVQGELHAIQDEIGSCTTIDEVLALVLPWRT